MAFINAASRVEYVAIAGQTVFEFQFKWFNSSDITVYRAGNLIPPSGYTLVGVGANIGGSITLSIGATAEDTVIIERNLAVDRLYEYVKRGAFRAEDVNNDQDYQSYLIQDMVTLLGRALTIDPASGSVNTTLPPPDAGKVIGWNEDEDGLLNLETLPEAPVDNKQYARQNANWVMVQGEGGGVSDHTQLTGRSTANGHPMDAITGLLNALAEKSSIDHNHNSIYYQKSEYVSASAGAADSGKPVVLNSQGLLDESMIEITTFVYQGQFTPILSAEYPDLTGKPDGSVWNIVGVGEIDGYAFTTGDLTGQTGVNGDYMISGAEGWVLHDNSGGLDPNIYYHLDGSLALTAAFQAGGHFLSNMAAGEKTGDAVEYDQMNTLLGEKMDVGGAVDNATEWDGAKKWVIPEGDPEPSLSEGDILFVYEV